jgi:hypothetical protein
VIGCQQGGHRYFEQNKPLSSLSSHGVRRGRKPDESHTNHAGGQPLKESVSPDTWTESGRTSILPRTLSSRESCAVVAMSVLVGSVPGRCRVLAGTHPAGVEPRVIQKRLYEPR